MKIGIDSSRLTRKDRTGTENYLYFTLKELFQFDKKNEYILYFSEEPNPFLLAELGVDSHRIKYKVIKKIISWTQISLSLELFFYPVDILYCPWHTIPGIYPFWKTKVISVIHDMTGRFIPTTWTLLFSNKIIAVSKSTRSKIVSRFPMISQKVVMIDEGYDKKDFYPRPQEEVDKVKTKYEIKGDYVLFVGSLSDRKNIENMINAFNGLKTDLTFVLGGIPLKGFEYLTELPAKFIGRVDQNDLASLYSGAKMFCFVSKDEGFGIPILEAMSCCVPVITSNVSSMNDIAGDAAVKVDPNSIEDIRNGMTRILEDSNLSTELVEKGITRLKYFSWESCAIKTFKQFEEIIQDAK